MADKRDLNLYIDERLRDYRPDRYMAGDSFFDRVIDSIPDGYYLDDIETLLRNVKKADVQSREKKARRNANALLREFYVTGQLELHWRTTANEPLSIPFRTTDDDGNESSGYEYVTLRAATPSDLHAWADNEEAAAQEDYEKRIAGANGARRIAETVTTGGFHQFIEWAETVSPEFEEGVA